MDCDFSTPQKANLTKHLASKHGKGEDGKELKEDIKCPHCAFTCLAGNTYV